MRSSIEDGNDGAAPTICSRYRPSISFLKTGSANLLPVSLDTSERPSSLRDQTGASLFSDVISS
jgi:hypothetical protein